MLQSKNMQKIFMQQAQKKHLKVKIKAKKKKIIIIIKLKIKKKINTIIILMEKII